MMNERTISLIGLDNFDKLSKAKILVVGLGGVGGYVCEILARSGVKTIGIVDFDKVASSNLNRQIIATEKTIGKSKTDAMAERLLDINREIKIIAHNVKYSGATSKEILKDEYDIIIDAIDSVMDKLELIKDAKRLNTYIISAMGAGNRYKSCDYEISDIFKTTGDPLAKKMRELLKKENIKTLDVCYTKTIPDIKTKEVSSIAYNPAMCGIKIASWVINKIIGE